MKLSLTSPYDYVSDETLQIINDGVSNSEIVHASLYFVGGDPNIEGVSCLINNANHVAVTRM